MLEIFMYPVSGIMKLWHILFAQFLDSSLAWLVAIVFLVITIRSFIAPLNWLSVKSGRIGALMRPEKVALDARLKEATTVEEAMEILTAQKELRERFKFNPAVGCLPIFIIMPMFLGLYQVVLRASREGNSDHVGLLNPADVAAFRTTLLNGVPITDFAREHKELVIPILVLALLFTVLNMVITLYRSYLTTQFDKKFNRRMLWFTVLLIFLVPWLLWSTAMNAPIPVAIIYYWGWTYLYTLIQTVVYELILRRRYPLPEEVHAFRRETIGRWRSKEEKRKKKARSGKEEKEQAKAKRKENMRIVAQARKQLRSNSQQEVQKETE
ncbi:membrane protein insertase YidC [Corynebacterium simulans]|uniref:membrane protein insertase YidC n=1 Tax=Corynebacterium simulans TaxID=146827 RepID=UPI0020046DE8|nr:membrane protein insertase YidC [Corynebacterium simulans]MCK6161750.1 membrane protein insertase YidC [Corynebacterium simulans]